MQIAILVIATNAGSVVAPGCCSASNRVFVEIKGCKTFKHVFAALFSILY